MNNYNRRDFLKAGSLITGGLLFGDSLFGSVQSGTESFIGAIKIVSFDFAPKGWALCNGQLLPISQYPNLFSLLGATYGGDGRANFGLPDFRGRVPIHMGNGYTLGERAGTAAHTISVSELPTHTHLIEENSVPDITMRASDQTGMASPKDNFFGTNDKFLGRFHDQYDDKMGSENFYPTNNTGGSQGHENRMPFLTLNFIIALQGIFPSQN